jgi:3-oxoadipate enol-lactonase
MTPAERIDVAGPVGNLAAWRRGAETGTLPVVLVHGINMSGAVWDGVADELAGERPVVTLDLRGHGDSVMTGPFDADGYASDVLAVVDALGLERFHLAGASFGGPVVCTVAAREPARVASVAALGSAVSVAGAVDIEGGIAAMREIGAREFFRGFMGQASFAPGTDPIIIETAVVAATEGRDIDVIADVVRVAFSADASEAVGGVKAPALVLTGEHDMTCPVAAGEVLAAALGTEVVVLPGRGHMAMVEDPDSVTGPLQPHLRAHDA